MGLSFSTSLTAQEGPPSRPPRPEAPPHSRGLEGERRGDRERGDRLRNLSPDQRQKVRAAFEKVWVRPEVEDARQALRLANETYRKAVEDALKAVDPEAAAIVERHRPEPPHYQIPLAQTAPSSQEPVAVDAALAEVQKGLQALLDRNYKRQRQSGEALNAPELHAKILETAPVKAALEAYKSAEQGETKARWEAFRKAYLDELVRHLPARSSSGRGGRPDGHGRGEHPGPRPPKAPKKSEEAVPNEAKPAPSESL